MNYRSITHPCKSKNNVPVLYRQVSEYQAYAACCFALRTTANVFLVLLWRLLLIAAACCLRRIFSTLKRQTVMCAKLYAAATAITVCKEIPSTAKRHNNVANAAKTVNPFAITILFCLFITITFTTFNNCWLFL